MYQKDIIHFSQKKMNDFELSRIVIKTRRALNEFDKISGLSNENGDGLEEIVNALHQVLMKHYIDIQDSNGFETVVKNITGMELELVIGGLIDWVDLKATISEGGSGIEEMIFDQYKENVTADPLFFLEDGKNKSVQFVTNLVLSRVGEVFDGINWNLGDGFIGYDINSRSNRFNFRKYKNLIL